MYGVGFYGVFFVIAAGLFVYPVRLAYRAAKLLGVAGAAASVLFLLIQFFLIKALCVYCIASAIITFLICIITLSLWKKYAPPHLVVVAETA
jgi:uncharacterized membrane protein